MKQLLLALLITLTVYQSADAQLFGRRQQQRRGSGYQSFPRNTAPANTNFNMSPTMTPGHIKVCDKNGCRLVPRSYAGASTPETQPSNVVIAAPAPPIVKAPEVSIKKKETPEPASANNLIEEAKAAMLSAEENLVETRKQLAEAIILQRKENEARRAELAERVSLMQRLHAEEMQKLESEIKELQIEGSDLPPVPPVPEPPTPEPPKEE